MTVSGPVRYGLVGYGLFGAHHASAIEAAPSAELAAIAVKSEASQAAAREARLRAQVPRPSRPVSRSAAITASCWVVPISTSSM